MKVLVLAIDGLEARLVEKWGLRGFKQKFWGTHDVTVATSPGDSLYTPILWAAFLLGEPPGKYGFTYGKIVRERGRVGYGLLYPLYYLRLKLLGGKKLGLRRFLMKLGLYSLDRVKKSLNVIESLPPELRERTFVSEATSKGFRVWFKEFPTLSEVKFSEVRGEASALLGEGLEVRLKYLNDLADYSLKLLNEALDAAETNDLILYYTSLIDIANHFLYRPGNLRVMTHLARYYRLLDREIGRRLAGLEGVASLIVSDHGYDPKIHDHSKYGFWSLNVEPPDRPKSMLDFRGLILKLLET